MTQTIRRRSLPLWLACLAAAVALVLVPSLPAAEPEDAATLDEELMESLDNELLEGLETIPDDDGAETSDEPNITQPADDEDAFTRVSKRMREAERLIPVIEAAQKTKKVHKEILTELEELIAQLEEHCKKCQGGAAAGGKSQQTASRDSVKQPGKPSSEGAHDANKPAKDSTEKLGRDEARKAALEQMKRLLKEDIWGELPAKEREQMLQLTPEQFLPKYELLIEEYYKRLAEKDAARGS